MKTLKTTSIFLLFVLMWPIAAVDSSHLLQTSVETAAFALPWMGESWDMRTVKYSYQQEKHILNQQWDLP